MLVSNRKKYIFIHIPRSAGTSITRALSNSETKRAKKSFNYNNVKWEMNYPHYIASEIRTIIGERKFNGFFKFAFVRNPWDRMVSRYWYLRGYHENDPDQKINDRGYYPPGRLSFGDWLMGNNRNCVHSLDLRQQKDWITNESGRIVIDYIGKYENLEYDFKELCKIIGVKVSLPILNAAKKGNYREYYNREAIDFVADRFKDDIATWGYQF